MTPNRLQVAALAGLLMGLTAACGDTEVDPTNVLAPAQSLAGRTLLECPVEETKSVTDTLGVLGGTIALDGHSITLPAGAVLLPTPLKLTVPAGKYVEVDIQAGDLESFEFQEPVGITISYERCTRSNTDNALLTVWHIDEETKALLEHMGGTDDKAARNVTFTSGHLSGFAIAN